MATRDSPGQAASGGPVSVIVGLGRTGVSCARHLAARGHELRVTDSRATPPGLAELRRIAPGASLSLGGFDESLLEGADQVVASPGVSLREPILAAAVARGLDVVGDIELFAREATGRIVGITGTNGKSTVTTLVGEIAESAGLDVRVGGNIGRPALELLAGEPAELYVLELSSYQLETTRSLGLAAATVLNLSPDHMDRYADLAEYGAAKARIFDQCALAVVNLDDPIASRMARPGQATAGFSLVDEAAEYALRELAGAQWLVGRGEPLLPLRDLRIAGLHNAANALAAVALADAVGIPRAASVAALEHFPGLPHRAQVVAEAGGVRYVDDSKATNVGAALATLAGLPGPLILIAGGDGKGQDFGPLAAPLAGRVKLALLIGRDARAVGAALAGVCPVRYLATLEEAVAEAHAASAAGDTVILSPACASLDMFRDYAHRGEVFAAAAARVAA